MMSAKLRKVNKFIELIKLIEVNTKRPSGTQKLLPGLSGGKILSLLSCKAFINFINCITFSTQVRQIPIRKPLQ